ncbi:MAG: thiopurine S-methyltransferase [Gammaproteobacteria bacterium]|nr:thiopurine S-methyltransferase [Gammaproteobacteria bacterium]MDH5802992.1 thiopurine S-methyltransferase [Gammaproteobacteria bacterium]
MDRKFWFDSWDEGGFKTSFHRPDVHRYILQYLTPEFLKGKRVLVPLCGKSVDLVYFSAHAEHVIGVELVEKAVIQFFQEQNMPYVRQGDNFLASGLTLLCRDFFDLTTEDIGAIDLIYDRASLVALPEPMRLKYIDKINELLPVEGQQFVNTIEYEPSHAEPPFSIDGEQLRLYYGQKYQIEHLENQQIPDHGLIRAWGLHWVKEHGFLLTRMKE